MMWREFTEVAISEMPATSAFRAECMSPTRSRWIRVRRRLRRCCWYHRVDWPVVIQRARQILGENDWVIDVHQVDRTYPEWFGRGHEALALHSLFGDAIVLASDGRSYINGQHRSQAIIDSGAATVIVERNPPTDPRVLTEY
jgi:hypothetical protein